MMHHKLHTKMYAILASAAVTAMMSGCSVTTATPVKTTSDSAASSSNVADITVKLSDYSGVDAGLPREYPEPKSGALKGFTIGFMNPSGGNENLQAVQDAAKAETEKLGGTFIAKDDQAQVNKQLTDFNQLLVQHVDAILLYPLDPKALRPSLEQAKAKGVKVIGYDVTNTGSEALPDGYTSQVMQGRDWQAWSMAKGMASIRPGGEVGLIGFAVPVPGIRYLMQRVKYWSEKMGLKVVGEQDNSEDSAAGGQTAATALLGATPKLDGIIAYNDPSAAGASAAAKVAGRSIAIIGDNGDDYGRHGVQAGSIAATFQNDAVGQGVQGVIAAYDALTHREIPTSVVRPPLAAVTSSTVANVPTWTQQLSKIDG